MIHAPFELKRIETVDAIRFGNVATKDNMKPTERRLQVDDRIASSLVGCHTERLASEPAKRKDRFEHLAPALSVLKPSLSGLEPPV